MIANCDIKSQQAAGRDYKFFFHVNKSHVLEVRQYLNTSVLLKIHNGSDKFFNRTMVMYPGAEH